jgi:hypothetical protein
VLGWRGQRVLAESMVDKGGKEKKKPRKTKEKTEEEGETEAKIRSWL